MADTKINDIATAATTILDTDLIYIGRSPFGVTDDRKMTGANVKAQFLQKANNLSDVTASTARTNLGLGSLATQSGTFSGTSSGTNTGDQNLFSNIAVSGQSDIVADSLTDTFTIAAGSNITLTTNAATDTLTIAASSGSPNYSTQASFYTDLDASSVNVVGITTSVVNTATATASTNAVIGAGTHLGIWEIVTSTNSNGRGAIGRDSNNAICTAGGGSLTYECVIYTPAALADVTDTYIILAGFMDGTADPSVITDGIYFSYDYTQNSGAWTGNTKSNGGTISQTTNTTPITPATWYRLSIVVNAAGTSVEYFVNGVSIGTVSANIPSGATRLFGSWIALNKSAGTNSRTMYIDYFTYTKVFTTPR